MGSIASPPPPVYRPPPSAGPSWQNNRSTSNYGGGGYGGNRSSNYGGGARTSSGGGGGFRNTGGGGGYRPPGGAGGGSGAAGGQGPRRAPKSMTAGPAAGSPIRPGGPSVGRPGTGGLASVRPGLLASSFLKPPATAMRPVATKLAVAPKPSGSLPSKSQAAFLKSMDSTARRLVAGQANRQQERLAVAAKTSALTGRQRADLKRELLARQRIERDLKRAQSAKRERAQDLLRAQARAKDHKDKVLEAEADLREEAMQAARDAVTKLNGDGLPAGVRTEQQTSKNNEFVKAKDLHAGAADAALIGGVMVALKVKRTFEWARERFLPEGRQRQFDRQRNEHRAVMQKYVEGGRAIDRDVGKRDPVQAKLFKERLAVETWIRQAKLDRRHEREREALLLCERSTRDQ